MYATRVLPSPSHLAPNTTPVKIKIAFYNLLNGRALPFELAHPSVGRATGDKLQTCSFLIDPLMN